MNRCFKSVSTALLLMVFVLYILTTTGFIFHFTINPLYSMISVLMAVIYLFIQTKNIKSFLIDFIIFVSIISLSLIISSFFIDFGWDSRGYHNSIIYLFKNGWNPIYDNILNFAPKFDIYYNYIIINSYPKFCEIISANIYSLTGFLESGKALNFILCFITFMYSFIVLERINDKSKKINLIFSFLIVYNPVVIYQVLTFYTDINLYLLYAILLLSLLYIEKTEQKDIHPWIFLTCASVFLLNTKVSGWLYLSIAYSWYFGYLFIFRKPKRKFAVYSLILVILTGLTCINPYLTNIKNYSNAFYPFFGPKKMKVIKDEDRPREFTGKNLVYRLIISTFSVTTSAKIDSPEKLRLKVPFSINGDKVFKNCDMRIGGFGYFFGGIVLVSLMLLLGLRFNDKQNKRLFFLIMTILVTCLLSNQETWWARYAPQYWLVPIMIFLFSYYEDNIFLARNNYVREVVITGIALIIFINSFIVNYQNLQANIKATNFFKNYYKAIKISNPQGILLYMDKNQRWDADTSVISRLKDYGIKYFVVSESDFQKDKVNYQEFIQYKMPEPLYYWKKK